MTRYLLDTNVLSATAPRRSAVDIAEGAARAWIAAHADDAYIPAIAVAEIAAGIGQREASGAVRQARELADWLRALLSGYPGRVLEFTTEAALHARDLSRRARDAGIVTGFPDLAIGCIASAHGLVVVTRNVRDFAPIGVPTLNPFA